MRFYGLFKQPIKKREKLLTMLSSFWAKFIIFVYGKFMASFPLIYSWHLTILGSCYCKKQIDGGYLCVCPLIDDKFRHNIVKVYCGTTRLRLVVPQPLWQCYDAIYHEWEERRTKSWRQFVNKTVLRMNRTLFAGHVTGFRPMKRKKKMYRMIKKFVLESSLWTMLKYWYIERGLLTFLSCPVQSIPCTRLSSFNLKPWHLRFWRLQKKSRSPSFLPSIPYP